MKQAIEKQQKSKRPVRRQMMLAGWLIIFSCVTTSSLQAAPALKSASWMAAGGAILMQHSDGLTALGLRAFQENSTAAQWTTIPENAGEWSAVAMDGRRILFFYEPSSELAVCTLDENGAPVDWPGDPGLGFVTGEIFAELAYVEVSTDGINFVRFPTVSLTPEYFGPYGSLNPNNLYNLAGRHVNNNGICTGTPFDLDDIQFDPKVLAGLIDLNNIRFVRIVDIPGNGFYQDQAESLVDPNSDPDWENYAVNHPIYDAWETWGSGGFDLEAIGVLHEQQYAADINLDGIVDLDDLNLFNSAWLSRFGQTRYLDRCDLAQPRDYIINWRDFAVLADQWYRQEKWR